MKPVKTLFSCCQALFLCVALAAGGAVSAADNPMPEATVQQQVDINSADATTLAQVLDGVGLAKARAIVEYREQFGKFQSVEQLLEVNGIGAATLDKNRHLISVSLAGAE